MTYLGLLSYLKKLSPEQLRQRVTLEEGCSDNVTHLTGIYKARKQVDRERLVMNADGEPDAEGCYSHWESTGELKFKKGQIYLLHDH